MLLKEWGDRVSLRGSYSTVGLRADADLMLWLVAPTIDADPGLTVALRRTDLGRRLELTRAFTGLVRPAEFTRDHAPAFVRGEAPRTYLCVYPFVRTPEWYLLPSAERAALLREHGEMGREFPDVLANTTSASASTTGSGSSRSRPTTSAGSSTASAGCARRRPAGTRRWRSRSSPASARSFPRRSPTWPKPLVVLSIRGAPRSQYWLSFCRLPRRIGSK